MAIQGHVDQIAASQISGWAIDWDQPAAKLGISVIVDGVEFGTCLTEFHRPGLKEALGGQATGTHEFRFAFDPPLDHMVKHDVEVRVSDKHHLLPNGRKTLFPKSHAPSGFVPIFLTSQGRAGTTMLMQEFLTHPDIAVADIYPFEVKLASYYASVLNVLSTSTFMPTESEFEFGAVASRDLIIGRNPWNRRDLWQASGGTRAERLMMSTFPRRLGSLLREIVEDYYGNIADAAYQKPRFFAEKGVLETLVRQSQRQMFGQVREVVMIRDPRDFVCSAMQFWKYDIEKIFTSMSIELESIAAIRDEAAADTLFVRYEDLVIHSKQERRKIYDFIGCASHFEPLKVPDGIPDTHRTSASPAKSIGRYKKDLDPAVLGACQERFGHFMKAFDYKL